MAMPVAASDGYVAMTVPAMSGTETGVPGIVAPIMSWKLQLTSLSMLLICLAVVLQGLVSVILVYVRKHHSLTCEAQSSPQRVLIVANRVGEFNGETGGGSIFRQRLFEALARTQFCVSCLSVGRSEVRYTESVRGPVMSPSIRNLVLTAQLVCTHDLVIISGSWSFLSMFSVYIGLLCGTPCITFVTMNSGAAVDANFQGAMWYLSYCLYMATDYFNCWFSVGAWTRSAEYLRVLSSRYVPVQGVVYCGDQYKAFQIADSETEIHEARLALSGGHPDRPLLLYCGRLLPEKRIPLLLAAKPEGMSLAIVGTGSEAEWLRSAHDPSKGIICLVEGMVSQEQLRRFYKAADIHVSASDFETLGNTVHEALLCGCPVVVQRAGGYVSQVCNGRNGYLVDWANVDEVQSALASVHKKGLSNISPLQRNTSDATEIIASQISQRVVLWKRTLGSIVAGPAIVLLWFLSLVYDQFAADSKRNDRLA